MKKCKKIKCGTIFSNIYCTTQKKRIKAEKQAKNIYIYYKAHVFAVFLMKSYIVYNFVKFRLQTQYIVHCVHAAGCVRAFFCIFPAVFRQCV